MSELLSRRRFLLGGAGATLAIGVGLGTTDVGRQLLDALPIIGGPHAPLDRTPMSERVGARFVTGDVEGAPISLRLTSVADLPSTHDVVNPEGQFVAQFEGPSDRLLDQNTYRFDTDEFGSVDLFMVPIGGPGVAPGTYSAVFNRIELNRIELNRIELNRIELNRIEEVG